MKRVTILTSLAAGALALGTAGCGSEAEAPVETGPQAPAGVTVTDARMTLPAVAGNPAAVYFTIENGGDSQVTIRAADVSGAASAMMHETTTWNNQTDMQELFSVNVPAGGELVFEPGGKHVMAMQPDESLEVGGQTEVTLTFAGGDKISFPAELRAPGDGDATSSADAEPAG